MYYRGVGGTPPFIGRDSTKVSDAKFKCLSCEKAFRREDFVYKHVIKSHSELFPSVPLPDFAWFRLGNKGGLMVDLY